MEKLIELLNEYDGTPTEWKQIGDKIYFDGLGGNSELHELIIISKYYGFIQRLVENDKINHHKISDIMIYSQWRYTGVNKTTAQRVDENYLDLLLMILSIQDSPIEFLISYLK